MLEQMIGEGSCECELDEDMESARSRLMKIILMLCNETLVCIAPVQNPTLTFGDEVEGRVSAPSPATSKIIISTHKEKQGTRRYLMRVSPT